MFRIFFTDFKLTLFSLFLEMSIGSDRDSVIESEDGDADEVRYNDVYTHII